MKPNVFLRPQKLAESQHRFLRTLLVLKARNPEIYAQLELGLHDMLDVDLFTTLRCPPAVLPTAQGRGQVAQEILMLVEHIDHYRGELDVVDKKARETQPAPRPANA